MKYFFVLLGLVFSSQFAYSQKIVGCYWMAGTGQTDFKNLCTHSYFKVYTLQSDGAVSNSYPLNLAELKQKNEGVKMIASIGGMMSSYYYPSVASDPAKVSSFVQNCVDIAVNNGYDGIDIDWHNQQDSDRSNFLNMLGQLKTALSAKGKILTTAITDINYGSSPLSLAGEICNIVDLFNVQASAIQIGDYDYEGERPSVLTLNSPYQIYDDTTNKMIAKGCTANKLVLGAPLKGHKFSIDPQSDKLPGSPGMIMSSIKYGQTCYDIKAPDAELKRQDQVPYAIINNNTWIGYEDPESIASKAKYANEKGLAGMFFYDTFFDDYGFDCDKTRNYPLIATAYNVLVPTSTASNKGIIGCYWLSPLEYKNFTNLCTHAFLKSFELSGYNGDVVPKFGTNPNVNELKQINPRVKMIGSINGNQYATIAADPAKVANFVRQAVTIAVSLGLDGIDVAFPNMDQSVHLNFVNLLKILKVALSATGKILTTVVTDTNFPSSATNKAEICSSVDLLNVQVTTIPTIRYNNYLTLNAPNSVVNTAVSNIIARGCPAEKILLGITTLSFRYWLYSNNMEPGTLAMAANYAPYSTTCKHIKSRTSVTLRRDQVPYTKYSPFFGILMWMTYEDPESVTSKVLFTKEKGLPGVFFFLAEKDDTEGVCGNFPFAPFTLISSAYKAMHG